MSESIPLFLFSSILPFHSLTHHLAILAAVFSTATSVLFHSLSAFLFSLSFVLLSSSPFPFLANGTLHTPFFFNSLYKDLILFCIIVPISAKLYSLLNKIPSTEFLFCYCITKTFDMPGLSRLIKSSEIVVEAVTGVM